MHGRDTASAAQREQGLRRTRERTRNCTVAFNDGTDIAAALRDAYRLAAQVFPARNTACFKGYRCAADAIIRRCDVIENLAALRVVLHVGNQDVDLALLEKLHARRGQDGQELHFGAEPFPKCVRKVHVETSRLLRGGIERTERAAANQNTHRNFMARVDLVEGCIGAGGKRRAHCPCNRNCSYHVADVRYRHSKAATREIGRSKNRQAFARRQGSESAKQMRQRAEWSGAALASGML